jgi:endonuclease IV
LKSKVTWVTPFVHASDSHGEFGSGTDRHANFGAGSPGLEGQAADFALVQGAPAAEGRVLA